MKKILVLGGTGFVGRSVCKLLLQQGWAVTVPTRSASSQSLRSVPGITQRTLDVHDEVALNQIVAGQDAVINLVAILHGSTASFERVHVELPRKLVRACAANNVRRLIHISALGADDLDPESRPSEYLRSKSRGEAILLHTHQAMAALDVTVIRPSVIFGEGDKFLTMFAKLQSMFPVMPLAGAQSRFQPVWVEDVAAAVLRTLADGTSSDALGVLPRVIEACGPQVFTLSQLVKLSGQLSGTAGACGRPIIPLPSWMARIQARAMELAPGEPLMSRDNLDSMKIDNVSSGQIPGLESLGIVVSALEPIAAAYLGRQKSV